MPETWEFGVYIKIECLRVKIAVCEMRNTLDRKKESLKDGWKRWVGGEGGGKGKIGPKYLVWNSRKN